MADVAHFALLCCPRTVEPGRQVLALHAVVLEAQVPQDDWLGTQEVVERCRVQLLICGSTAPASVVSQRHAANTKKSLWKTIPIPFIPFPQGVFQLQQLHYKHWNHHFTRVFFLS